MTAALAIDTEVKPRYLGIVDHAQGHAAVIRHFKNSGIQSTG
jgi:hypothetical protein